MNSTTLGEFSPICVNDFYCHAERNMKPDILTYFKHGATNEITLAENEKAFKRFLFLPRMLRDVSTVNLRISLLKSEVEHPFGFSPTAFQKFAHVDGELATAKAAALTETPMILSSFSSVKLEDVAACYLEHYQGQKIPPLWFQLYNLTDREIMKDLIERVENSGFTAIIVTVDSPKRGIRYQNMRLNLSLTPDITYANFLNYDNLIDDTKNTFAGRISKSVDNSLTWSSLLTFLRSVTSLPIILKGILTVEDAKIAVEHKVDGIFVSNHGGRRLDSVPSGLESLVKIAPHVPPDVELYMDGGVRSGEDILKALALGAKAVFIGRPVLWALSYEGTQGIIKLINILRNELDVSLALCGISDVNEIPRDLVIRTTDYYR